MILSSVRKRVCIWKMECQRFSDIERTCSYRLAGICGALLFERYESSDVSTNVVGIELDRTLFSAL